MMAVKNTMLLARKETAGNEGKKGLVADTAKTEHSRHIVATSTM